MSNKLFDIKSLEKKRQCELYNNRNCYGKAYNVSYKTLGIVLDFIVPCTFGLITLAFVKIFKNRTFYTYRWE